jgi:hypothetical protein
MQIVKRLLAIAAAAAIALLLQTAPAFADDWDDYRQLNPPAGTVIVESGSATDDLEVHHTPSDCPNGPEVYYANPSDVTSDPYGPEYGDVVVIEEQPAPDTVIIVEEQAQPDTVIVYE